MHEPAAATTPQSAITLARLSGALDSLSGVIAGFALLAGARAFMFIALLGWREPVLGGAGLVLLAVVGWLRCQCGEGVTVPATQRVLPTHRSSNATPSRLAPPSTNARDVACYNRPLECDPSRGHALAEPGARRVGPTRTRA
ncbi:hypothetical protein B0G75_101906 [Paraburkholderia sp. BL18I3N2]|uniref:hypothetical protein n=1 Tax=Paraburkholderia sp. BL18I3N2 TaxID=1938799 RepID=UPI000D064C4B|nr:hypothetical protein [Paraburkholderia sp. BL18I3N2]PRX36717.1 hypothetical protein B0G75_101906 [Paraburkholderia sp. BL18I3N2]